MSPPSSANPPDPAPAWSLPGPDALPCALATVDASGRMKAVNTALCALVGSTAQDLQGRPFDSLLTTSGAVLYQTYLLPLLRLHGHLQEFSIPLRTAGGPALDVLLYATSRHEGEQRAHDILLVPIRQRRRVEEELLRVKRAADESPGMIFQLLCTPDGGEHFPYVSEAVRTLYSTTPQAARVSASAVFSRVLAEDSEALQRSRDDAAAAEATWRASARIVRPDGTLAWHDFTATPRRLANGTTLWHGYVADVTQRRVLEQALAARETARQASEAKSEFLARVSHELRTPLNAILGFAQLMRTQDADNLNDEQRRRLSIMHTAGQGLLHLINDVLDVTSIEKGQISLRLEPVSLDAALDDALAIVEPMAQDYGITVERDPPAGLVVNADVRRLRQVLVNLLSNGIKYNRPGGRVAVRVHGDATARRAAVDVSDTGPGLTDAQQQQLFEPFNRLGAESGATEGSGLGLVISRQLLQLMDGDISVRSTPGAGSLFRVQLPLVQRVTPTEWPSIPSGARPSPAADSTPPTCGRVLYVEDNPVNVLLMEAIVGLRPGIRLQVCGNCGLGLQAALADPPALLMLDMQLPDGDGNTLLMRMRTHAALERIPAVAVSAAARADDLQNAQQAGFVAYWTKPLEVEEVLAGLDQLLAGAAGH